MYLPPNFGKSFDLAVICDFRKAMRIYEMLLIHAEKIFEIESTGKTFPTSHFRRYPERRRRPPGVELPAKPFPHATFAGIPSAVAVRPVSNLPAKPFPHATFAGIPSAVAVRPVSNYRQNLSHTPLLPVSRAPSPSARCRTYRQNLSPATFAGIPRTAKIRCR